MSTPLRCAVVGVGAVGGTVAARLAQAGHNVSLIARGERLRRLQSEGLCFAAAGAAEQQLQLPAGNADDFGTQDVVFVAVKGDALASAVSGAAALIGPETLVVPMINGIPWWYFQGLAGVAPHPVRTVDPDGALLDLLAPAQVAGCVVYITSAMDADGVVRPTGAERLIVGAIDGQPSQKLLDLVAALDAAGIATRLSEDIRSELWTKVALNLATNPLSVVCQANLHEQFHDDELLRTVTAVLNEAVDVARAYGVQPGLSVEQMIALGRKVGAFETSMLQDYRRARPLELTAIGEAVLELGREIGHPMPVARSLVDLADFLGRRQVSSPHSEVLNS